MIKEAIEIFFKFALTLNVIIYLPQIFRLLKIKQAKQISLIMFITFNFMQLIQIFYAYIHNDVSYLIGSLALLICCSYISILIIYYRIKNYNQPYNIKRQLQ